MARGQARFHLLAGELSVPAFAQFFLDLRELLPGDRLGVLFFFSRRMNERSHHELNGGNAIRPGIQGNLTLVLWVP